MALESKEDFDVLPNTGVEAEALVEAPFVVEAPPMPRRAAGPPRWTNPMPSDKVIIKRAPLPASAIELLETLTAAEPIGIPAAKAIGTGTIADIESSVVANIVPPVRRVAPVLAPRAGAAAGDLLPRAAVAKKATLEITADLAVPFPKPLADLGARIKGTDYSRVQIHPVNNVTSTPDVYVPQNRRAFKEFIIQSYWRYKLKDVPAIPDPDACAKAAEASKKEVKTFAYQSFVRDYMQRPSPYRGVLVYHGLGSGKTCTSIAALEALYQEQQRPIFILTPASLQPNYRDEITKCGPYIFRLQNHWTWIPVKTMREATAEAELLIKVVGLSSASIRKRGGGWLPDPAKPVNFESLTAEQRKQITDQINETMDSRFIFINYNGILTENAKKWACAPRKMFDGATIIIDEVHNLIRTINNSGLSDFYKDEPRSMSEYAPKFCEVAAKKYNKSYLLYRMLCDAVGAKIIALSATPIINFPQEVAILSDLLAGDGRMAELITPVLSAAKQEEMKKLLAFHPEVDFHEIQPRSDGSGTSTLRITPVPSGFRKVVNPTTGGLRGFVRIASAADDAEIKRERDLAGWFGRINDLAKSKGFGDLGAPRFTSFQRLPDEEKQFVEMFIDTDKLEVKDKLKLPLMARLSGLISYYKGGKADLMATSKEYIVDVDMSDVQLKEYTDRRNEEITKERKDKKLPAAAKKPSESMFAQATKSINSTFKIFSRAACNFAFPTDMKRPIPADFRDVMKLVGAKTGESGDAVADEIDRSTLDPEGVLLVQTAPDELPPVGDEGTATEEVDAAKEALAAGAAAGAAAPASYADSITAAIREFRARATELFGKGSLKNMSPKFQAILDRIETAPGPVLVYSNFKTLEGVGLFGLALETQQAFTKLDIVQTTGGGWTLSPETLRSTRGTPYYITYTGDEDRTKRNILLAIFNGKWAKVPGALAAQVQDLTGVRDNKDGKICKVFMITQSGAEGISLSNVRQVHIMEPYWNYVRLDQVKGRAIRICSHMDLPPEKRHVDTFIYISKFSDAQKAAGLVDKTLFNFDEGNTTDQNIWNLMNAKKKLADSLLDVMKRAAVDCELNSTENGGYACYRFEGASMEPLFHPLLTRDLAEGAAAVRAKD